jgi:hypothetical protein
MIRSNRIMTERWRVSPALSPPPTALSGGRVKKPAPFANLLMEYAPLRRKGLRAVRSPSFTARFFDPIEMCVAALHEDADRAMVTEGWPT